MQENRFVISALVDNRFGVLTRIAGLFARRGYNIDSLTVSTTQEPDISRMTIVVNGDKYIEEQILKQLRKQVDVKFAEKPEGDEMILRELALVKIQVDPGRRREALRLCKDFSAEVADVSDQAMVLQLTDESVVLDRFIEQARHFGILELCRTGMTALERGERSLLDHRELTGEGTGI